MELWWWTQAWMVLAGGMALVCADRDPHLFAVEASAVGREFPPMIELHWPADTNSLRYEVRRKSRSDSQWGPAAILSGNATSFSDPNVAVGGAYEYQLIKQAQNSSGPYTGYGYIYAGIDYPLIENRGTVILVVANNVAPSLGAELDRLAGDLFGDGWQVIRHEVSPQQSPPEIKALIQRDYTAHPTVRTVFLFGHVPVPYSGDFAADNHPNHRGAWPADSYYGDMDGNWTDATVTSTNAERTVNWNIPGDGKFDQSDLPSDVELEVGRVDLSNMTAFSNKPNSRSELDLLRQYLEKDHRFRMGLMPVERRALICDNFGDKGDDPISGSGWRNFSAFFGADRISVAGWSNYFPAVTSGSYLWSYGSGGGTYYYSVGVGSSDDFALQDPQVVFTMFMGSYFGDWNNESNFLRAPLGSTSYTLTSCYAGYPHYLFQHMALGETIGYGIRLTQNNSTNRGIYPPFNSGPHQVHIALMGDPTLRLHPFRGPGALQAGVHSDAVDLSWALSPDPAVQGYSVYRSNSLGGPFQRVNGRGLLVRNQFSDSGLGAGEYAYLVRAVKLETSSSGTYWNPSQGVSIRVSVSGSGTGSSNPAFQIGNLKASGGAF